MKTNLLTACGLVIALTACHQSKELKMGSYAYDARFLAEHGIQYVELTSSDGRSKVMLAPDWQGRVGYASAAGGGRITDSSNRARKVNSLTP